MNFNTDFNQNFSFNYTGEFEDSSKQYLDFNHEEEANFNASNIYTIERPERSFNDESPEAKLENIVKEVSVAPPEATSKKPIGSQTKGITSSVDCYRGESVFHQMQQLISQAIAMQEMFEGPQRTILAQKTEWDELQKTKMLPKSLEWRSNNPKVISPDLEITELSLGAGISNPNRTACYINATLQGLRFCPSFREFLEKTPRRNNEIINKLSDALLFLYGKIEMNERVEIIQEFRALLLDFGWPNQEDHDQDPLASQQDAAAFCRFLLSTLQIPLFQTQLKNEYKDLGIYISSLNKVPEPGLELVLRIDPERPAVPVDGLAIGYNTSDKIVKEDIKNGLRGITLDPIQQKILDEMPDEQVIDIKATLFFTEKDLCPKILPISITCFDNYGVKLKRNIPSSKTIDFPILNSTQKARYHLVAAVVHQGETIRAGHYYTYVPKFIDGQKIWVRYSDADMGLTDDSDTATIERDMAKNGYLYFYEFDGFTED